MELLGIYVCLPPWAPLYYHNVCHCRIDLSDVDNIRGSGLFTNNEWMVLECDHRGWTVPLVVKKLMDVIRRGFEGRVKLIGQDGYPFTKV